MSKFFSISNSYQLSDIFGFIYKYLENCLPINSFLSAFPCKYRDILALGVINLIVTLLA